MSGFQGRRRGRGVHIRVSVPKRCPRIDFFRFDFTPTPPSPAYATPLAGASSLREEGPDWRRPKT